MNYRCIVGCVCLGMAALLIACSSERTGKTTCLVGKDTLTLAEIQSMEPDSAPVMEKFSRAALQMALSREAKLPCGNIKDNGFYSDLSNQLSLQTGAAWSVQSAACLYSAAKAVRMKYMSLPNAAAVGRYVDSLFSSTVCLRGDSMTLRHMAANDSVIASLDNKRTRLDLEKLLSSVFHISEKTAYVLADFLISEETETAKSTDVSSYIKGLVADEKHPSRKAPETIVAKAAPEQDPKLALKFRPQHVISDSIKKHIHDLEAIYKKQLKSHPNLSGTVWVTFVILPDGSVATTQIHSADIAEKDFLNPFSQYVQRIRFSKIPDTIGPMTFEFPFEFSPEN